MLTSICVVLIDRLFRGIVILPDRLFRRVIVRPDLPQGLRIVLADRLLPFLKLFSHIRDLLRK
jgi:hypothetical protein